LADLSSAGARPDTADGAKVLEMAQKSSKWRNGAWITGEMALGSHATWCSYRAHRADATTSGAH
jgi:hypothetical protein